MKGIYIWTNDINRFQYVGKTNSITGSRAFSHTREDAKGLLAEDMREFGLKSFSLKIYPYPNLTAKELGYKEKEWILKLETLAPNGYNQRLPDPERERNIKPPNYFHEKGKYAGLYESETRCQMCKKRLKGREEGVCFECEPKWWEAWKEIHVTCDFCGCDGTHKDKAIYDRDRLRGTHQFCDEECYQNWLYQRSAYS